MAHIISKIETGQRMFNKVTKLSCMPKCPKKEIHDADAINERIMAAAKVKQQLEADIFERDKKLKELNIYG